MKSICIILALGFISYLIINTMREINRATNRCSDWSDWHPSIREGAPGFDRTRTDDWGNEIQGQWIPLREWRDGYNKEMPFETWKKIYESNETYPALRIQ